MPETLSLKSYLDSYGHTLTLVEYLAKQLSSHPQLKEIPLLGETDGLTISSDAAWEVVLAYLRENNLSSKYLELLENPRLAKQKKLEVILEFLQNKEIELPLANLAIENNLATYEASLNVKAKALDPSSPLQKAFAIQREQIKKYHESLRSLQSVALSASTIQRSQLEPLLPPPEVLSDPELKLVQEQLVSLLPSLATASELTSTPKPEAIYKTLSSFATKNTALSKFLVFNASEEQKVHLANFVESTSKAYTQKTGQSLIKLEQAQRSITANSLSSFAFPRLEAERVIVNILADRGLMPTKDAAAFASQLFTESVRSAYTTNRQIAPTDLVAAALSNFSIAPNSAEANSLTEAVSPLFSDLLAHNQTQILEARQHGTVPGPVRLPQFLLPTEVKLALSTHTDPTLLSVKPAASFQALVKQYGVQDLQTLRDQALTQNDLPLLAQLALLDNYEAQLPRFNSALTPAQKLSVGLVKANHTLGRGLVSYQKNTTKALDKLYNFNEKLDRLNPITRVANWWADTEMKIMDTNWGWALNPVGKAVQVFDSWKEKVVTNVLKKYQLNPPKNLGGRFVNWAAQMYYQGSFTVSGFVTQSVHWAASAAYGLAKKGAKKLATYVTKKAVGFAIKVLGEAAVEQIAGSVIPFVGNVIAVVATVIDIAKTLWQNRELVADLVKKGAVYLAAAGFALWSFIAAFLAKLGTALIGSALGATIGFFVGGPVGALVGGIVGGALGYLATNIASIASSVAASVTSFASAISSALVTAGSQVTIVGAGILGVTYYTALTIVTTMTTAEIPAPNTYAVFPPETIECSTEKIPIQSGYEPVVSSAIASRGWEIVSDLYQGFWCYWNRSPGDVDTDVTTYPPSYPELFDYPRFLADPDIDPAVASNSIDILFWCTWLIQKSYIESGNNVLAYTLGAAGMQADFMSRNKFILLSQANNTNVVPGSVVFFHVIEGHAGTNHVALVTKVNEDAIYYVQSNGSVKEGYLSFSETGIAAPSWATIPGFGTP